MGKFEDDMKAYRDAIKTAKLAVDIFLDWMSDTPSDELKDVRADILWSLRGYYNTLKNNYRAYKILGKESYERIMKDDK